MRFKKQELGQGMVEYALIIILIALVVIVGLTLFGTQLSSTYSMIANNVAWPIH